MYIIDQWQWANSLIIISVCTPRKRSTRDQEGTEEERKQSKPVPPAEETAGNIEQGLGINTKFG